MPTKAQRELQAAAQQLDVPVGNTAKLKIDTEALDAATQKLQAQVDSGRLPGYMSCVMKEGQLVHFKAYGFADLCGNVPMRADTMFRLYSQTKPVTVAGFLVLLEQGLVSIDDPINKYIPSFAKVQVQGKKGKASKAPQRAILVRDLLAHTSGVGFGPGFGNEPENDYEETYVEVVRRVDQGLVTSLAAWCDEIAKLPLRFEPGKDWGYGYSSDILGRVIEVVSGKPLDKFLQAEVLDKLDMRDTFFSLPPDRKDRLAALYAREPWDGGGKNGMNVKFVTVDPGGSGLVEDASKRVQARQTDGKGLTAPSASVFLKGNASAVLQGGGCVCSIAGGLVSTMRDYARFSQMLLNEGHLNGLQFLRRESVQLIEKDFLNEYTTEKRKQPMWVWNCPGVGFSPLGQIGVEHPDAKDRKTVGSAVHTVHWGGAGGSGYMLNWPHRVQVLTYTGCTFDTWTQKTMWRAAFGALRRGGARKLAALEVEGSPRKRTSTSLGSTTATPGSRKRRSSGGGLAASASEEESLAPSTPASKTPMTVRSRRPSLACATPVPARSVRTAARSSSKVQAPPSSAKRTRTSLSGSTTKKVS